MFYIIYNNTNSHNIITTRKRFVVDRDSQNLIALHYTILWNEIRKNKTSKQLKKIILHGLDGFEENYCYDCFWRPTRGKYHGLPRIYTINNMVGRSRTVQISPIHVLATTSRTLSSANSIVRLYKPATSVLQEVNHLVEM